MKSYLPLTLAVLALAAVQLVCTFWIIWSDREMVCNVKEVKYAMLAQAYGRSPAAWLTLKGRCLDRGNR